MAKVLLNMRFFHIQAMCQLFKVEKKIMGVLVF